MHQLPINVLARISTHLLLDVQASALLQILLWKLNKKISSATLSALYHKLIVSDAMEHHSLNGVVIDSNLLESITSNYLLAERVEVLVVQSGGTEKEKSANNPILIDFDRLISQLPNLKHLTLQRTPTSSSFDLGSSNLVTLTIEESANFNFNILPGSLCKLSLSQLTQEGCKLLGKALHLSPFVGLEEIVLISSPGVDDCLMNEIGRSCSSLQRLRIEKCDGTKLTHDGLKSILVQCDLRVLELIEVEGRFAGNTWPVLAKYGKNLASLQLAFSESTSHHSWVLDHLLHVDSIIKTNKLEALSLIRTGKRNTLAPKLLAFSTTLPAGLLSTILEQGKCLKRLSIDFYEISLETLKLILDACPNLFELIILVTAPFKTLLTIGLTPHLQRFQIQIHPTYLTKLAPTIQFQATAANFSNKAHVEKEEGILPEKKEWRKWLKTGPNLSTVIVQDTGTFHFRGKQVQFEPVGISKTSVESQAILTSPKMRRRSSAGSTVSVFSESEPLVGSPSSTGRRRLSAISSTSSTSIETSIPELTTSTAPVLEVDVENFDTPPKLIPIPSDSSNVKEKKVKGEGKKKEKTVFGSAPARGRN